MANKERDIEDRPESSDVNPSTGTNDQAERVRGTGDEGDEADDFEESDDEVDEDEEDEGTF